VQTRQVRRSKLRDRDRRGETDLVMETISELVDDAHSDFLGVAGQTLTKELKELFLSSRLDLCEESGVIFLMASPTKPLLPFLQDVVMELLIRGQIPGVLVTGIKVVFISVTHAPRPCSRRIRTLQFVKRRDCKLLFELSHLLSLLCEVS
jgi:hypothetical protein